MVPQYGCATHIRCWEIGIRAVGTTFSFQLVLCQSGVLLIATRTESDILLRVGAVLRIIIWAFVSHRAHCMATTLLWGPVLGPCCQGCRGRWNPLPFAFLLVPEALARRKATAPSSPKYVQWTLKPRTDPDLTEARESSDAPVLDPVESLPLE